MKLPKVYEPSKYEADIYALWEKSQAFQPRKAGKSYTVVVPPPNANGNLHIGHALTNALQDISVRYHRLRGESALLVPGADHAGFPRIAEQGHVEDLGTLAERGQLVRGRAARRKAPRSPARLRNPRLLGRRRGRQRDRAGRIGPLQADPAARNLCRAARGRGGGDLRGAEG